MPFFENHILSFSIFIMVAFFYIFPYVHFFTSPGPQSAAATAGTGAGGDGIYTNRIAGEEQFYHLTDVVPVMAAEETAAENVTATENETKVPECEDEAGSDADKDVQ